MRRQESRSQDDLDGLRRSCRVSSVSRRCQSLYIKLFQQSNSKDFARCVMSAESFTVPAQRWYWTRNRPLSGCHIQNYWYPLHLVLTSQCSGQKKKQKKQKTHYQALHPYYPNTDCQQVLVYSSTPKGEALDEAGELATTTFQHEMLSKIHRNKHMTLNIQQHLPHRHSCLFCRCYTLILLLLYQRNYL